MLCTFYGAQKMECINPIWFALLQWLVIKDFICDSNLIPACFCFCLFCFVLGLVFGVVIFLVLPFMYDKFLCI